MIETVRERVVENAVESLRLMTVGAGFSQDYRHVVAWRVPAQGSALPSPGVFVFDMSETVISEESIGELMSLELYVELIQDYQQSQDVDGGKIRRALIGDATKALLVDITRGGIARDTRRISSRTNAGAAGTTRAVVQVLFRVTYGVVYDDPTRHF